MSKNRLCHCWCAGEVGEHFQVEATSTKLATQNLQRYKFNILAHNTLFSYQSFLDKLPGLGHCPCTVRICVLQKKVYPVSKGTSGKANNTVRFVQEGYRRELRDKLVQVLVSYCGANHWYIIK